MADDERTGNGTEDDTDTEVLSFGMGDQEDTDASDEEDPQLTPADPDAGFDGWLDGEDDPYRELTKEEGAAEEVADWLAFARGEGSSGDDEEEEPASSPEEPLSPPAAELPPKGGETDVEEDVEELEEEEEEPLSPPAAELPPKEGETDVEEDVEELEEEEEEPLSPPAAGLPPKEGETDVEDDEDDTDEFDIPVLDDDTGDIPVLAAKDEEDDEEEPPSPPAAGLPLMGGETDDPGELPVVAADEDAPDPEPSEDTEASEPDELDAVVEFGAITLEGESEDTEESDGEPPSPPAAGLPPMGGETDDTEASVEFTEEDYLGAATQDHTELAAAIAAAEGEETEQVALSADIPGLESGVVGFDDVVEDADVEAEEEEVPAKSSDLILRVGTAVALVVALAASLLWRPALIVFALAVFIVAAGEFYSALIHRRFKPMSLFGFLGIAGAALGTAAWGVAAIPIALALMATVLLLFNAVSPRADQPAANFSLTVLVAAWVGGLGAFAFDIIAAEEYQVLVISLVALVALVDISAFFVGRSIGRRPMAPVISPKKTIEGFVAGTLTALAVGAAISYLVDAIDLPTGLVLGAVVAVFAPIGDLAVSVVKRSLDIKDMGSILPGHGGLLDRIDALIMVIPAVWVVLTWYALI